MIYFVLLGTLLALWVFFTKHKEQKRAQLLEDLRSEWGHRLAYQYDLETSQSLFELHHSEAPAESYCLDDDTWQDLNLDRIFHRLNRTRTPLGSQALYDLLRHPILAQEPLLQRDQIIQALSQDSSLREELQVALESLAHSSVKYLPYTLWGTLPEKPPTTVVIPFLGLAAALLALLVAFQVLPWKVLLVIVPLNATVRFLFKRKIENHIYALQYLNSLIGVGERLLSIEAPALESIQTQLQTHVHKTRVIVRQMFAAQLRDTSGVLNYLNIFFLLDIWSFYAALGTIRQEIHSLRKIYTTLGYVEALIAIASFRKQYAQAVPPVFQASYTVDEIYNPLVKKAVPNSLDFSSRNMIITGSNMAGKTTFLRTMGINAILAQTIYTCLAQRYAAPFLKVMSSIARSDSISEGKSYYLAEVESVLRLLKASREEGSHLFMVDEIFRGTNSVERLAASIEVLKYLQNDKDYVLVSTHDLELATDLNQRYQNVHFREEISEQGLFFDYKLHSGMSSTRNAIALLEHVGYPPEIVSGALQHLEQAQK